MWLLSLITFLHHKLRTNSLSSCMPFRHFTVPFMFSSHRIFPSSPLYHISGHTDTILAVRWGVDEEGREDGGRTLVSTSKDKTIRIWDLRAGRCATVIKAVFVTCLLHLLEGQISISTSLLAPSLSF